MELPRLVYDDFYKFIMSAGMLLLLIGLGTTTYLFLKFNGVSGLSFAHIF